MFLIPCNAPGDVASVPVAQSVEPTINTPDKKVDFPVSAGSTPKTALENNGAVKGAMADDDCSGDDDTDDVMAVAITYLEEDCRLLRAQK